MTLAWRTGMFHHWDPKKYPSLDKALGRPEKVVKGDPEQAAASMREAFLKMAGESG